MNRIKKELEKAGIIYNSRVDYFHYRLEDDNRNIYVGIENGFIITVFYSEVLPPILYIYDKNYNEVGQQDLYPDHMHFGCFKNRWGSVIR